MTPAADSEPPTGDSSNIPWKDLVRFMRQLSHDLRNHLNAAELQSAYLSELTTDPELKDEIKRLRQMMSGLGATLQKLSASLGDPKPNLMSYGATDFVEDVRHKLEIDFPKETAKVEWDVSLGEARFEIDPQLLQEAILELFANAFRHQKAGEPLKAGARIDGSSFVFTLREPKEGFDSSTQNWGRQPLQSVTQGHYGLGLRRSRVIVEAHRGQLQADYDSTSAILTTTVILPLTGGNV